LHVGDPRADALWRLTDDDEFLAELLGHRCERSGNGVGRHQAQKVIVEVIP
jgi:hypothetical protein